MENALIDPANTPKKKEIRKPIGYAYAEVRIPIYEGDNEDSRSGRLGDWFVFEEPGVTSNGLLGVCRREAKIVSQRYEPIKE